MALLPFCGENFQCRVLDETQKLINKFHTDFLASMSDDLHTTAVLDDLMDPLKAINSTVKDLKKSKV